VFKGENEIMSCSACFEAKNGKIIDDLNFHCFDGRSKDFRKLERIFFDMRTKQISKQCGYGQCDEVSRVVLKNTLKKFKNFKVAEPSKILKMKLQEIIAVLTNVVNYMDKNGIAVITISYW